MARMINWWGDIAVVGGMFPLIVADIPPHLKPWTLRGLFPPDSREARFGKPLEEVVAGRDKTVEGFRRALDPMRLTLKTQPYLGGDTPDYADYIVFGLFQWARVVSPFKLLAEQDPVYAWREKLLDASIAWRADRRAIRRSRDRAMRDLTRRLGAKIAKTMNNIFRCFRGERVLMLRVFRHVFIRSRHV